MTQTKRDWEIHKGNVGTVFRLTVTDHDGDVIDISSADTKKIVFKKPNGQLSVKDAEFVTDGSDGKLQYTTVDGDLDYAGWWSAWPRVTTATQSWNGEDVEFEVKAN